MSGTARVFISYSHDSDEHRERVLALSERLRADGIETVLDRYVNGSPPDGWPRWMMDGLEEADRVLVCCTETYYRRFRGHEVPGKGKGVDWEGAIITQEIYDARSKTARFVPVFFDRKDEAFIPEPVRGQSFHCLDCGEAYAQLYDVLLDQAGVEPGPVGEPKRRPRPRAEPLRFGDASPAKDQGAHRQAQPVVDLSKLPRGAENFLGREEELALLDAAWAGQGDGKGMSVVTLIAPGGTGKTALMKRWIDRLAKDGWRGAERVFGWSFYSQGTGDDRQASDEGFLNEALKWFGVTHNPAASAWDKGKLLASAVAQERTLLILDGCEPLQYPPGPLAGELRASGLKSLLGQLALVGQPGLTVVSSREVIADLAEYLRKPDHADGSVLRRELNNLAEEDGARLLHRLGCVRAGAAGIGPEDEELRAASREVKGHALTLNLLGRYLRDAEGGDIRRRDSVRLIEAAECQGAHTFRVLAAYERWFERAGEKSDSAVELAALRLVGFFDRPADPACIGALRQAPPIAGLSEPLFVCSKSWFGMRRSYTAIADRDWKIALTRLADCGLIEFSASEATIDAHPLVREYLGRRLRESNPEGWREGHQRIYEHLKASVPHRPDGIDGLQPLYQAVAHGCLAGMQQQACDEVYRDRIKRGGEFYSTQKLGAFGADLGAVASFFDERWSRVSTALSEPARAWLLNEAAFRLRALGRLEEAIEPMRAGLEMAVRQEDWNNAARYAGNLSELALKLGRVGEAVAEGARSVEYAERSRDTFLRMAFRTTHADALQQQGSDEEALALFAEAEKMQAERQPKYPLLYSLQGYQYCELLLSTPERAAWRVATDGKNAGADALPALREKCESVSSRAAQTLAWVSGQAWVLDIALDHLSRGRSAFLLALVSPARELLADARSELAAAVDGLRAAGQQDALPPALLARAWLDSVQGDPAAARADLDEAWQIAVRGGMRLHMADIHLHRARLFKDRGELAKARALIEQCGYRRRSEELADAEAAAANW